MISDRLTHFALLAAMLAPAAAGAAVKCGTPNANNLMTCSIDQTIDPAALCNDGTTPAFWYRPGSGGGANTWLIWLEGGHDCSDATSCDLRAQNQASLLTSNGFIAPADGVGILSSMSANNPDLYTANTVFIHYCSSDSWSGGYQSTRAFSMLDPTTWNFEGHRIAVAAVKSLAQLPNGGPNSSSAVLIGGSSAGGEGITINANDIIPVLPAATVGLINDAGFANDIGEFDYWEPLKAPYEYQGSPTAQQSKYVNGLLLWHGRGDARCDATAKTLMNHINCLDSSYVLHGGYVTVPAFVAESQLDTAQSTLEICPEIYGTCSVPTSATTAEGQYITFFAHLMANTLRDSGGTATYSVYSPDVYIHVILGSTAFTTAYPFGSTSLSAADALETWLDNPAKPVRNFGTGPGIMAHRTPH